MGTEMTAFRMFVGGCFLGAMMVFIWAVGLAMGLPLHTEGCSVFCTFDAAVLGFFAGCWALWRAE